MKKIALTAASLAMVAMTASPALAQSSDDGSFSSTDNSINNSGNDNSVNTQVCEQVVQQYNNVEAGDATASGDGAIAAVAAENNASVEAVQNCVQGDGNVVSGATGGGTDVVVEGDDDAVYHPEGDDADYSDDGAVYSDDSDSGVSGSSGTVSGSSGTVSGSSAGGTTASATYSVLPDTGGASLIALGAGALLVGGGLVARRIVR